MSDQDGEELLPLKEAAERIGTTLPRLRRMLARPTFAKHVKTITRKTRTGTRTTQTVPVSVLVLIQKAMENPSDPSDTSGTRHVKTRTITSENGNENTTAEPVPVLVPVPLGEFVALKEAAAVAAKLTDDLARERAEREREQAAAADALKREQEARAKDREEDRADFRAALDAMRKAEARAAGLEADNRRMLEAMPVVPVNAEPTDQSGLQKRTSDTESGQSAEPDTTSGQAAQEAADALKRAEEAEGRLQVANDTIARERAERTAAEAALQVLQEREREAAARPWWQRVFRRY